MKTGIKNQKIVNGLIVLTMMLGILCLTVPSYAKTLLRMNHQFPAAAAGSKIDQWFADEVKKASDGELEIQIFWSNALGAAKENLTLLRTGAIDMAGMSAGFFSAELPFYSAPNSLPMALDNICQSSALMKALMERIPAFEEEAKANGIKPIFFHLLNPYLLVTREPVTKLDDLKGKKIRTWGEDMPRLVQAAGGTPVTIFLPELYENLQRGVIDGCPFSVDFVVTYKIYEVAKHITEVVMWEGPAWGVIMSQKSWEKLSPDHQAIILQTAERARKKELTETAKAEAEARKYLKKQGVTFHEFPVTELEKWKTANPDFYADWISKMEKTGKGDAARETVKLWKDIRSWVNCP
ncbi:MAG: C4-dicarboxylate TRAP transporter substrate-binding protein [Deltaproteobacteria bacterium]|nr:C4-dicarboxylate TRAP transporter substrate-binding protein [Deltaproteobacteria bacterium]